jgi:hypothetical protein
MENVDDEVRATAHSVYSPPLAHEAPNMSNWTRPGANSVHKCTWITTLVAERGEDTQSRHLEHDPGNRGLRIYAALVAYIRPRPKNSLRGETPNSDGTWQREPQ